MVARIRAPWRNCGVLFLRGRRVVSDGGVGVVFWGKILLKYSLKQWPGESCVGDAPAPLRPTPPQPF